VDQKPKTLQKDWLLNTGFRLSAPEFWKQLGEELAPATDENSMLLFLHGFDTSFDDRHTHGQLSYDLKMAPRGFLQLASNDDLLEYEWDGSNIKQLTCQHSWIPQTAGRARRQEQSQAQCDSSQHGQPGFLYALRQIAAASRASFCKAWSSRPRTSSAKPSSAP